MLCYFNNNSSWLIATSFSGSPDTNLYIYNHLQLTWYQHVKVEYSTPASFLILDTAMKHQQISDPFAEFHFASGRKTSCTQGKLTREWPKWWTSKENSKKINLFCGVPEWVMGSDWHPCASEDAGCQRSAGGGKKKGNITCILLKGESDF